MNSTLSYRTIVIVHDTAVPAISDFVKAELNDDWNVIGFKCFNDAYDFLVGNDDIFALICDGEIPKILPYDNHDKSEDTVADIDNGEYLTRWMISKALKLNIPYLVIQWTSHHVYTGPSSNYPIFELKTGNSIPKIIRCWHDYLTINHSNDFPLASLTEIDGIRSLLNVGTKPWEDLSAKKIGHDALSYIHNIRHSALSIYLAIYNDIQNIDYWKSLDNINEILEIKVIDAIDRIKSNITNIDGSLMLGGLDVGKIKRYIDELCGADNASVSIDQKSLSFYHVLCTAVEEAILIEAKIRLLCADIMTCDDSELLLGTGMRFCSLLISFQSLLQDIVTHSESFFAPTTHNLIGDNSGLS